MEDLKTPPSNVEAERAVLGSILIDTTVRGEARVMDLCLAQGVTTESFYDPRNRAIYNEMLLVNRLGKPLDALVLVDSLRANGRLDAVGGVAYV